MVVFGFDGTAPSRSLPAGTLMRTARRLESLGFPDILIIGKRALMAFQKKEGRSP